MLLRKVTITRDKAAEDLLEVLLPSLDLVPLCPPCPCGQRAVVSLSSC